MTEPDPNRHIDDVEKSLDERLRGAHLRQLTDTQARLAGGPRPELVVRRSRRSQLLSAAAAIALIALGSFALVKVSRSDSPTLVDTQPASPVTTDSLGPLTSGLADSATPSTDNLPISSVVSTPGATTAPATTTSAEPASADTATTATTVATTTIATTTIATTTLVDPGGTTESSSATVVASGVANEVCPSGFRAELELASLSYVGSNQGWNRLADLVDEQNGPHYFQAWEPGYPNPVTVLVELDQPVAATELRVAQDPFTPVSGAITITASGQEYSLALGGTGGWVVAELSGEALDQFTITRTQAEANIMEVLLCTASD